MDNKKLLEAVARLVKRQVEREVSRRMDSMRAQVISEVAGMLDYSERKLITMLNEVNDNSKEYHNNHDSHVGGYVSGTTSGDTEFERAINNLKSMPNYRGVDKIQVPPRQRKFSNNPILDNILSETEPLQETRGAHQYTQQFQDHGHHVVQEIPTIPQDMTGIDGRPIDASNPTVQKVMDVLANTNFKEKFDRINEAGDAFRDGAAPAPRYNSKYFEETIVD
jgi:hypothetical protein